MSLGGMQSHPRVLGRPLRGAALLMIGFGLLIGMIVVTQAISRRDVDVSVVVLLPFVASSAAAVAFLSSAHEVSRPVWGVAGHASLRRLEGSELRWSTRYRDVVASYDRVSEVGPRFGRRPIGMAVEAILSKRLRAHIAFDDSPLHVGRRGVIRVRLSLEGRTFGMARPRFHLRCLRESHPGGLALRSMLTCLADLVPHEPVRTHGDGWTELALAFDLPLGLPGSDLLPPQPVYWELTVKIDGLERSYEERFFVPVET